MKGCEPQLALTENLDFAALKARIQSVFLANQASDHTHRPAQPMFLVSVFYARIPSVLYKRYEPASYIESLTLVDSPPRMGKFDWSLDQQVVRLLGDIEAHIVLLDHGVDRCFSDGNRIKNFNTEVGESTSLTGVPLGPPKLAAFLSICLRPSTLYSPNLFVKNVASCDRYGNFDYEIAADIAVRRQTSSTSR